ncbi:MAG: DUF4131 domain-containing protein [Comamonadaceae bacterium]|nr:MAG: DUF4131 domain-containing protein [Comamonadaceae bacterium]
MPQRTENGLRFLFDIESSAWPDETCAAASSRRGSAAVPRLPSRLSLGWYADGWRVLPSAISPGRTNEPAGVRRSDGDVDADSEPPVGIERAGSGGAQARAGATAPPAPRAGERWCFVVRLKAPHGQLNPHGFDYELWAWEQGLQATGSVRSLTGAGAPRRLDTTWEHPIEAARERVRDAILERVGDARSAGLVAALVVGDQSAIPRADWDVYRATGVAHLVSISGLHVTMFAWLAAWLVGWSWRQADRLGPRLTLLRPAPEVALAGGVLLATLYAAFSGWGVPAQRTVWMLATVALLRLGGRRWPWPATWITACAVVVAMDPWALMQPGFWLSFVAVGVLFASDAGIDGAATDLSRWHRAGGWLRRFAREQWVITLALTPLTLLMFQQVSLVGLPANAIAIPWVTLVITPLAMAGIVLPASWSLAAGAGNLLTGLLHGMAQWSFASLALPAPPGWAGAAGLAGGLLLAMRLPGSTRLLGLPLLLPALWWPAPRPPVGEFSVLAADVGQGNAVLVRTAGHSLLYDAGPRYGPDSDAGDRVLVPLLRALGVRLDLLVLSHRDLDHVGGAEAVLRAHPSAGLLASLEPTHPLRTLRPMRACMAGQRWEWDGVGFEVLHPLPGAAAPPGQANHRSCVLRVSNGRASALLAGDIERPDEAALVQRAGGSASYGLRADFLLVPHHGSKTSSSAALLEAVRPRFSLAQAGYRNRFGHPAPEVADRHRGIGASWLDSARCGAAEWSSRLGDVPSCEREMARRYWHHRMP